MSKRVNTAPAYRSNEPGWWRLTKIFSVIAGFFALAAARGNGLF